MSKMASCTWCQRLRSVLDRVPCQRNSSTKKKKTELLCPEGKPSLFFLKKIKKLESQKMIHLSCSIPVSVFLVFSNSTFWLVLGDDDYDQILPHFAPWKRSFHFWTLDAMYVQMRTCFFQKDPKLIPIEFKPHRWWIVSYKHSIDTDVFFSPDFFLLAPPFPFCC